MHATYNIGIDIGGTHISSAVVDRAKGVILPSTAIEYPVDSQGSAEEIIGAWHRAIMDVIRRGRGLEIRGIGWAMPGPFDYDRGIGRFEGVPKFNTLKNVPVKALLQEALKRSTGRDWELCFINDATAYALGEYRYGAAKGAARCWVLTLGTGLGSTFLVDGRVTLDDEGVPEGGYLYNQPFREGWADDYFSTRWFMQQSNTVGGVKALAASAEESDPEARRIFQVFSENLAEFLTPWIRRTRADRIVLAGGIAKSWRLWGDSLIEVFNAGGYQLRAVRGALGRAAPLLGAVQSLT